METASKSYPALAIQTPASCQPYLEYLHFSLKRISVLLEITKASQQMNNKGKHKYNPKTLSFCNMKKALSVNLLLKPEFEGMSFNV